MRLGVIGLLVIASALAQPTRIVDTIYSGNEPFQGRIVVVGPDMTTADGRTIVRWRDEYHITDGKIDLLLEPNDTATPAGTSYRVRYYPRLGVAWSEEWVVPSSPNPVRVHQVRRIVQPLPHSAEVQTRFADAEVPAGPVDGINRVFVLANAPNPPASLILIRNGLILRVGVDYVLVGQTITFIEEQTPQVGDILLAWYRY